MKLFMNVKSISDCRLFQADLHRLVVWGNSFGISLNVLECSSIKFIHRHSSVLFANRINDIPIKQAGETVRDLGIILSKNLSPVAHVQEKCC